MAEQQQQLLMVAPVAPAVIDVMKGVQLTRCGCRIDGDLGYDRWRELGSKLREVEGAVMWWIGDWLNYGERAYGSKYAAALEATGYSYQTARNAKWVATCFHELSFRKDNLSWTHHMLVAGLPPEEARELLDKAEEGRWTQMQLKAAVRERKRAEYLAHHESEAQVVAEVHGCSAQDLLAQIEPGSVDLLLTDPPYSSEWTDMAVFREFVESWVPEALGKLKRTARAYICIGAYPIELYTYLDVLAGVDRLPDQVLVWEYTNTLGPKPSRHYFLNWQAILYLVGPDAPPLDEPELVARTAVMPIAAPQGAGAPRLHEWQKPSLLGERLIRHSTTPGATVLDPFAGTGTFLVAAAALGRQGIGAEIDSAMLDMCRRRGLAVVE